MSYTYTQEVLTPEAETTFVPAYARKPARTRKVKTWMVLAPVAGLVLVGGAALMLMNGAGEVQPLDEPVVAPVAMSRPTPLSSAPLSATPEADAAMIATPPVATPAPAAPVAPVTRRVEPQVRRSVPAPVVTPRVEAPVEVTAPRPYEAAPTPPASAMMMPNTIAPSPVAPSPVSPSVIAPAPVPVLPPASSAPVEPLG